MTYAVLFYSHQLGAICMASAWILALDVADGRRRIAVMAVAGLLAGAAPLADYQAVFAGLPVAVHAVVRLRRRPGFLRALGLAAAGAALPIAALLGYHAACFGSPWRTGYDASTTFAVYHQHGFLGITALRGAALWGSLGAPENGLLTLSPGWLLAIPGGVMLWRRGERAMCAIAVAVAAIYVLFISSINFWRAGWEVGPRYIAAMLPFLLPPIAALLEAWRARPVRFGLAAGLLGAGVCIYVLSSATFPNWPDSLRHPLWRPADTPRVEKVVEQQIARPFHEERAPLREERLEATQVDHCRVGLDLTEIRIQRAAQRQARRYLILDVEPYRGAGIGRRPQRIAGRDR